MTDPVPTPRLATRSIAGQRPYQEDAALTETLSDGRTLVAVADGMGGHAAGDVASALALESLVQALEDGRSLEDAFVLANDRVRSEARDPSKKGMGTTLVVMLLEGDAYRIANVGDSRGYLLSGDDIEQLTKDHSFVADAVEQGVSREEARALVTTALEQASDDNITVAVTDARTRIEEIQSRLREIGGT